MRNVKWIFVVLLITSLVSFVDKDKNSSGWNVGDKAPDFSLTAADGSQLRSLKELKGNYVVLNFWASYDAESRMQNIRMYRAMQKMSANVKMVSVSFDEYESVFSETIKTDMIEQSISFLDIAGESSVIFKKYRLGKGFKNYLLDEKGVIIAKNLAAEELSAFLR